MDERPQDAERDDDDRPNEPGWHEPRQAGEDEERNRRTAGTPFDSEGAAEGVDDDG